MIDEGKPQSRARSLPQPVPSGQHYPQTIWLAPLVLPQRPSPILTRELLYTGLTRARSHVTIVGGEEVLRRGVAEQVQRASGIQDALWGGRALVDADVIRPGY